MEFPMVEKTVVNSVALLVDFVVELLDVLRVDWSADC
jgi:hypothetical protein